MTLFLDLISQLGSKGVEWAWKNQSKVMDLINRGFSVKYIINYIKARS